MGGRFPVLSAVGLLPTAVAGVDIEALVNGAANAVVTLFDYDTIQEIHGYNIARDAGEKRDYLYNELIKRLLPPGRVDDVLAATSDKAKLSDLAKEFGLKI